MECNREDCGRTTGGGPSERVSFSAGKKNSWEAWAAQHLRSGSQAPIAEGFSHRAFPSDSAHALPGIFWSLPMSRCPISRSVFQRDRKSTRLNSSHLVISYAVFCLKKKKT